MELQGNNLSSTILEWATENDITLIVMGTPKSLSPINIVYMYSLASEHQESSHNAYGAPVQTQNIDGQNADPCLILV